jgi:hypothetical protein
MQVTRSVAEDAQDEEWAAVQHLVDRMRHLIAREVQKMVCKKRGRMTGIKIVRHYRLWPNPF